MGPVAFPRGAWEDSGSISLRPTNPTADMAEPVTQGAEALDRIEDVLDQIRPAVRSDGGDIELVRFDEASGRVEVRMVGACYACPLSMATLRAGIEQRLRMAVPEVRSVEAIE